MTDKLITTLEHVVATQFIPGNQVDVLRNGVQIFPAMLKAIDEAEESIDLLTFVYWQGDIAKKFAESLARRAAAGVRVRVLLDAIGCLPMASELTDKMQDAGAEVRWFRPVPQWKVWKWDNRTHRKILICDQKVGFTGGVGIAEEWEGDARSASEWRETHFRLQGPVIKAIASGFISNWTEAGGELEMNYRPIVSQGGEANAAIQVINSPSSLNWSDIATVFRVLISMAKSEILIATAYFVPDEVLMDMLISAVERGVKVQILVPGKHSDQRVCKLSGEAVYEPLLLKGVEIYSYNISMMHTKAMLVDGQLAMVGSANMNHRSMSKDEELSLIIDDNQVVQDLTRDFNNDLTYSTRIDLQEWRNRSWTKRLSEKLSRVLRHEL